MFGHPTKYELTEYAEALADGKPMPARIAGHVTSCASCKAEAEALSESFTFLASAPMLECAPGSAEQILMAASRVRQTQRAKGRFFRRAFVVAKGLACAAGIVLVAAWVFTTSLDEPASPIPAASSPAPSRIAAQPGPSAEELQRKASEIESLASAVNAQSAAPVSPWERQHRQMVMALQADRTAAFAALQRNPGCDRASRLVTANLEREAQVLRTLYVEQGR